MWTWAETVGRNVTSQFAGVGRLRKALLILAAIATTGGIALYCRQINSDNSHRPLHSSYRSVEPQWSWICNQQKCERKLSSQTTKIQSLQTCNMLCASTQLWPQPTGIAHLSTTLVPVHIDKMHIEIAYSPSKEVTTHLHGAFDLFKKDLKALYSDKDSSYINSNIAKIIIIRFIVNGSADPRMRLDTDESFNVTLNRVKNSLVADISSHSFCGARHGLETLNQLIWYDPYTYSLLTLEKIKIEDAPKFGFRGLLLDTSRNYFPVSDLLRTIDTMASAKLNTFHWHATDSQAFPLQLESVPELAQHGAYGPGAIYTTSQIKEVVNRARLRGIRVLLEVDAPGHVGRAWSWGRSAGLGDLAFCVEAEPWTAYCGEPPCGQLNPRNPNVYKILQKVYNEIISLTGVDDLFHLGADEVFSQCWEEQFNDTDHMTLWIEFTRKAMKALERANGGKLPELTLLWSSQLTRAPYLNTLDPRRIGIQVWGSSKWEESLAVLDSGFRAVLSHVDAWYLDCGFGSWRDSTEGHCGPYRTWQQVYEHRPWPEESLRSWKVAGGEACQWTEQLGEGGLDARVWPRAAALAERLWSDPVAIAKPDVYLRLDTWRSRAVARGVRAAPLWPKWCSQNPYACLTYVMLD